MDVILAAIDALNRGPQQKQAAPKPPPPKPSPKAPVKREPPPEEHAGRPAATGALQGMFEDGKSLLRAVIAAEVLGPPAALREHAHWSQPQPNEPST